MNQPLNRAERRQQARNPKLKNLQNGLKPLNGNLPPPELDLRSMPPLTADTLKSINTSELNAMLQQVNQDQQSHTGTTEVEFPEKVRTPKFKALHKGLLEGFAGVGMMLAMLSPDDGMVFVARAESLADRWTDVAEKNESVYKALNSILQGEVYTALALEMLAVGSAIAKNHGFNIGEFFQGLMQRRQKKQEEKQPAPQPSPPEVDRNALAASRLAV